jgi:hypothetical protein
MSEWWTYTLSDFLLFSPRTYYRLFELYNGDIWPAQIVTLALGVAALFLLRYPRAGRGRIVAAILAGCWLWVAWAFHWRHYATINWAAIYFAWAFVLEALLLIAIGVARNDLSFESTSSAPHRIGCALVLFALAVQPLAAPLAGRGRMQVEVFGAAPDPTAVATLGFLLAARGPPSRLLWAIPVLWCVLSGAVLWTMDSPDAFVTPAAALLAVAIGWSAHVRSGRALR